MRILVYILIIALFSCNQKRQNETIAQSTGKLKPYQEYCLSILKSVTSKDAGYVVSDSFHLWTEGYLNNGWKPFYITRTLNDGFYYYIFWRESNDTFLIYNETQSPIIGFVRDSLYDVNGDNYKDFVITEDTMNGQCQPQFSKLFCFDIEKGEFLEIKEISSLPNIKFQPVDKTVSGEIECKMIKEVYKFKWVNDFKLDTLYYRTLHL
jgi:hypothetical protein